MPNEGSAAAPLAGWYVISLRPLGQHVSLRRAAERRGARLFAISTLRLSSLDAGATLAPALAAAQVIVSSPAAARFAGAQQALRERTGQRWYAPGDGSAAALRRAGISNVIIPERGADSEALLALPDLQAVRGQSIGLLTAPGGRDLIAATLAERGAQVLRADVYRRLPLAIAPTRQRALAKLPARSALLVSSGEALSVLWQALDEVGRAALQRRLAVASSERLRMRLQALGFARVIRAASAHPAALLDALVAHVGREGFR